MDFSTIISVFERFRPIHMEEIHYIRCGKGMIMIGMNHFYARRSVYTSIFFLYLNSMSII